MFKKINFDIIVSILLIAFAGFLFYRTYYFTRGTMPSQELVATLWPRVILGLLVFVSIIKLINAFVFHKKKEEIKYKKAIYGKSFLIFQVLLLIALYTFGMNYVGFILSTLFFQIILLYILKQRNVLVLIGLPVFLTIVIGIIFLAILYVPFPRGIGTFDKFTLFIYSLIGR